MAKKKDKKLKISKFFLLELSILGLLLITLCYDTLVYQSNNKSANKITEFNEIKAVELSGTPIPKPKNSTPSVTNLLPNQYGKSIKVPILTYHYIGNNPNPKDTLRDNLSVSPDKFESQMDFLAKSGYNSITLDTLYAGLIGTATLPAKPVVLTFDDGYIDFYVNAYPILKRYQFHAISFIPTGLINQGYYLSWPQILEMDQSGLISFQAHTVNHSNLTLLTPDQIKYQITESKRVLETRLGHPVNFFAYPYGASNSLAWSAVREAGFIGAAGSWAGDIISEGNIFDMPRIKIGSWDAATFASRI